MSKEREAAICEQLQLVKHTEAAVLIVELLELRRERHRTKLESQEDAESRGRAKECKDVLQIFN